jgi:hypothetical protein
MKSKNKASRDYGDAFNKEFNESPATYFGPLAYTNIMIVAEAIKRAGTLESEALIKALEKTKYESPLGDTFVFVKSLGINHQAGANPKLMQWQGGKIKIIWPWEFATAKLIYPFPAQGFNKAAAVEIEEKKKPAPAVKQPAGGGKVPAAGKKEQPVPAVKPTTSAPATKPATATTTTPTVAPAAKPATTTTTTTTTAPAKGDKTAVAAVIPAAEKEKVDMTGTWNLSVITPRGPGSPDFILKQEGNKLTGDYSGRFGQASVTGAVQGRNFEMKFTLGGMTTVYKGKVDGKKMSGDIDFAGQETGTFTGEKK